MKINFIDLNRQYLSIKEEIDKAIQSVIDRSAFILGEEVTLFEKEFADFCGVKYAVGVDSGISALELGMRALGIKEGDEVITPVNSFIASSSAISFTGAKPILIDCQSETYNIDPELVEKLITKKTKALMPVHLYGQMADMDKILEIAKKNNLKIIEDACQSHGARYKGKRAGSFGDFGAFSFYPGKNLGAYGDGGMIVTNDESLADEVRMMRNYGQKEKYHHERLAWNRRLDNLQAAVLRVKLKKLEKWNSQRWENAKTYERFLTGLPVICPKQSSDCEHIFHCYVIRVEQRNDLQKFLSEKGISTGIHYPIPIHMQNCYINLGYRKGDFPVSEKYAEEILSLPMFPELREVEIKYVALQIKNFFGK